MAANNTNFVTEEQFGTVPKKEKGDFKGECNRTACDNDNAVFLNYSTNKYYCGSCARAINEWNPGLCVKEEEKKKEVEAEVFEIDFFGSAMVRMELQDGVFKFTNAMDGRGYPINVSEIKITKLNNG